MIKITKRYQQPLILILGIFIIFFILLQTTPSQVKSTNQDGYVQLIENATVPILLGGQEQQSNLQLRALIQNTPVRQVRIYDISENLLLRVQNTAEPQSTEPETTHNRQVLIENNIAGILQVDIEPILKPSRAPVILWSLSVSFLLSLLFTGGLVLALRNQQLFGWMRHSQIDPIEARTNTPNTHSGKPLSSQFPIGPNLLVLVRIQVPQGTRQNEMVSGGLLVELADTIGNLAKTYGAELVSAAPNTLIFSITGKANRQNIQQALVLCWGLTQLSGEISSNGEAIPGIQSFAINPDDLQAPTREYLAYCSELDERCNTGHSSSAFVASSLVANVDQGAFELEPVNGDFKKINKATASIAKLWKNQRARQLSRESL